MFEAETFFTNLKLSPSTVTRRVEELAENVEKSLKDRAEKFVYFSVANRRRY